MRSQVRALLWFVVLLAAAPAGAGSLAPPARSEVDALLSALEKSGCEFNRNGSWHPAAEARKHLERKLDYLDSRNAVRSADQFIELAGSASSVTGQPYLVKCGAAAPVESGKWLATQLNAIRAAQPARTPAAK